MTFRFDNVTCSQCGADLGPGDHGVSSCAHHGGRWVVDTAAMRRNEADRRAALPLSLQADRENLARHVVPAPDPLAEMTRQRDELLEAVKDLAWRMGDIRDMLMTRTFNDEALYGCDEWSTPTVNLRTAVNVANQAIAKCGGAA